MHLIFGIISIIFLGFSFIAVVLPGLPATPFIFLSVFFAMRSSEKLTNYIRNLSIYKNNLEPFINDRVMSKRTKIKILITATSMIMIPIVIVPNVYLRIFLILVIIFKYVYFIYFIETAEPISIN